MRNIFNQIKLEMNDLKKGLINAGFICENRNNWGRNWDLFLDIRRENEAHYTIGINIPEKEYCVQRIQTTIITKAFEDLNHLSKLVFAFTHKDLNFEAKKYTWSECFLPFGFFVNEDSHIHSLQNISDNVVYHNAVPTHENAASIDATTQLMQICARINEDFGREMEDKNYYYPVFQSGNIYKQESPDVEYNQFKMNSNNALQALIETNTPLLLQYFEKQAK